MLMVGGIVFVYFCCLVGFFSAYDYFVMPLLRELPDPDSTTTPPVRQLAPYREDQFGKQQSREKMLEDEVSNLRNELEKERESSQSIYDMYRKVTGRQLVVNGRYLDIKNRSGQLLERHSLRNLKRGTNNTGPR